jgi:hypothetical protein
MLMIRCRKAEEARRLIIRKLRQSATAGVDFLAEKVRLARGYKRLRTNIGSSGSISRSQPAALSGESGALPGNQNRCRSPNVPRWLRRRLFSLDHFLRRDRICHNEEPRHQGRDSLALMS